MNLSGILAKLQIVHPIVQAPMLGVTTPDMVAVVANEGGLGSLPVGGLSPDRSRELISQTKQKTGKPFAVNLFVHDASVPVDMEAFDTMQDFLADICKEFKIPFERKLAGDFKFYGYEEQIDLLIGEQISIVSFTFGVLSPDAISRLKGAGTTLIGTATCVDEARILENAGIDMVVAQGIEAGGHRGTFLSGNQVPQIGLMSLLPQVVDAVNIPVIAAGGLYNGATMKAALALGAEAVQIGSMFITSDESAASHAYQQAVLRSKDTSTELTRAFSGRWARGVRNELMERMQAAGIEIPYYTYQNGLTAPMRAYAQMNNLAGFMSLWAGQSAGFSRRGTTKEIFLELVSSLY